LGTERVDKDWEADLSNHVQHIELTCKIVKEKLLSMLRGYSFGAV